MSQELLFALTNFFAFSEALLTCAVFFIICKILKKYSERLNKKHSCLILAAIPLYAAYRIVMVISHSSFATEPTPKFLPEIVLAGSILLLFAGLIFFIEVGKIAKEAGADLDGS